jgi:NAD-specific glutamate dehydrogenase
MAWRDDKVRATLIREAAGSMQPGKTPRAFAELLFDHTNIEDLANYDAASLAFLAEQAWEHGTETYRIFIRSLLELTDNLDADTIVPPVDTVRHDGDDPYLVVAADKGTATFSDTANAISAEKSQWLGDAFASGGSQGYDHKKMGITARGAWEAVKRHFRELGTDIQTVPFTAAGVGDMSGDVFGNGMLLSPATRLVASSRPHKIQGHAFARHR